MFTLRCWWPGEFGPGDAASAQSRGCPLAVVHEGVSEGGRLSHQDPLKATSQRFCRYLPNQPHHTMGSTPTRGKHPSTHSRPRRLWREARVGLRGMGGVLGTSADVRRRDETTDSARLFCRSTCVTSLQPCPASWQASAHRPGSGVINGCGARCQDVARTTLTLSCVAQRLFMARTPSTSPPAPKPPRAPAELPHRQYPMLTVRKGLGPDKIERKSA
jgi:hypothetical protein